MAYNGEVVQNRTSELISMYIKIHASNIIHFMLDDRVAQSEPHMRSHFTITMIDKMQTQEQKSAGEIHENRVLFDHEYTRKLIKQNPGS